MEFSDHEEDPDPFPERRREYGRSFDHDASGAEMNDYDITAPDEPTGDDDPLSELHDLLPFPEPGEIPDSETLDLKNPTDGPRQESSGVARFVETLATSAFKTELWAGVAHTQSPSST
jgi:hypothetical protein